VTDADGNVLVHPVTQERAEGLTRAEAERWQSEVLGLAPVAPVEPARPEFNQEDYVTTQLAEWDV
jgi:hypothetical protein